MSDFHIILTPYEMRIEHDKSTQISRKKSTFKESKKIKIEDYKTGDNSDSESDTNKAKFVRNIKRGTYKYKVKIPLK
jgi:hypothetical protein